MSFEVTAAMTYKVNRIFRHYDHDRHDRGSEGGWALVLSQGVHPWPCEQSWYLGQELVLGS